MVRLFMALLACVSLTACGRTVWVHADPSQQRWATDTYACERDTRQSGPFATSLAAHSFFDRCMGARGWTKTREP